MGPVARLVRSSHERFDGRGYPDGRAGEEIPMGARIISVCDAFHAMTTDRPYRKGMSTRRRGRRAASRGRPQFDPGVVEAFIATLSEPKRDPEPAPDERPVAVEQPGSATEDAGGLSRRLRR